MSISFIVSSGIVKVVGGPYWRYFLFSPFSMISPYSFQFIQNPNEVDISRRTVQGAIV
jgi:hypothetical protein